MNKTKQIIVALTFSIVIMIAANLIYIKYYKRSEKTVYILKESFLAGESINLSNLQQVNILNNSEYVEKEEVIKYISECVLAKSASKGQVLTKELFVLSSEYLKMNPENLRISIPVKDSSYAASYQIKKGDKVNIYYTSRANQTSNILKNYEKKYSSESADSFLTCKLIENIYVMEVYDDAGKKALEGEKIKEVVISTNNEVALVISNLKEQGEFNICPSNK